MQPSPVVEPVQLQSEAANNFVQPDFAPTRSRVLLVETERQAEVLASQERRLKLDLVSQR